MSYVDEYFCPLYIHIYTYEPPDEKTNVLVSDLVRHKPAVQAIQLQKMARTLTFRI